MLGSLAALLSACTIGGIPAQCGTVTVPENRAEPAGAQIALKVAVLPATRKALRRPDAVFYVTGGPGGVDMEALPFVAMTFTEVNAHRDIVFVDQRGVGGSNPLSCKVSTQATSVAAFVSACLGVTTADVGHYRTPDAVDDLDAVRQALGYRVIDVWGGSYGATAVQVYLRRHAETVRTAILDGPTLLDVPVFERWASSAQRALGLLDARCRADRACRRAFPHWRDRFPALLAKLASRPVRVGTTTIDAAAAASTVHEMTATVAEATLVPYTLAKAESGTYLPLAEAIGRHSSSAAEFAVMPVAIMCTEPWAARDQAAVAADARGSYLGASYLPFNALAAEFCAAWPKPDPGGEDWSRVRSDAPALFLVGGADPKDPPANSAGVEQTMPNAKVVVVPGGAHGVAQEGCVPALLDRFLERGTTKGLDTSCAAKALVPYPPFRVL